MTFVELNHLDASLTLSLFFPWYRSLTKRIDELCTFPDEAERARIISGLRWVGLFSQEKATVRAGNLLDTLCAQLEILMKYGPDERDFIMLQHKFVVEWSNGDKVGRLRALVVRIFHLILFLVTTEHHHVYLGDVRKSTGSLCHGHDRWNPMRYRDATHLRRRDRSFQEARNLCAIYQGNLRAH